MPPRKLNQEIALHKNPHWHRTSSNQKTAYSKCKTRLTVGGRKYIQDDLETQTQSTVRTTEIRVSPHGVHGVLNESTSETKSVRKSFQVESLRAE